MALKTFASGEVLTASETNTYLTGPAPKVTRSTADTATTDNVNYSVPTGFVSFTIAANSFYIYRYCIIYKTAVTTTGLHHRITQTATHDEGGILITHSYTTDSGVIFQGYDSTAGGDAAPGVSTGPGATVLPVYIDGFIDSGATAGTLTWEFRSEISGSSVTVNEGSFGYLIETKAPL